MRTSRVNFLSVISAFIVMAGVWSVPAAQSASTMPTGYYVCEFDVAAPGGASTSYQSDVIPNTGFRPGPVAVAFRDFVNVTYHTNARDTAVCSEFSTEAMARQVIKSKD